MNFEDALWPDYDPQKLSEFLQVLPICTDDDLFAALRTFLGERGAAVRRAKIPEIRANLMQLQRLLPATAPKPA